MARQPSTEELFRRKEPRWARSTTPRRDIPQRQLPQPESRRHPDAESTAANNLQSDKFRTLLMFAVPIGVAWLAFSVPTALVVSGLILGLAVLLLALARSAADTPLKSGTARRKAFRYPLWTVPLQVIGITLLFSLLLVLFLFLRS